MQMQQVALESLRCWPPLQVELLRVAARRGAP